MFDDMIATVKAIETRNNESQTDDFENYLYLHDYGSDGEVIISDD